LEDTVDPTELQREVAGIRWFHRIDLGGGVVTAGEDDTPDKLSTLGLPERLDGLSVLDIGAWDGFFSFEAERRGARRVPPPTTFAGAATDGAPRRGSIWLIARFARTSRAKRLAFSTSLPKRLASSISSSSLACSTT
jgi:hypothetical protein